MYYNNPDNWSSSDHASNPTATSLNFMPGPPEPCVSVAPHIGHFQHHKYSRNQHAPYPSRLPTLPTPAFQDCRNPSGNFPYGKSSFIPQNSVPGMMNSRIHDSGVHRTHNVAYNSYSPQKASPFSQNYDSSNLQTGEKMTFSGLPPGKPNAIHKMPPQATYMGSNNYQRQAYPQMNSRFPNYYMSPRAPQAQSFASGFPAEMSVGRGIQNRTNFHSKTDQVDAVQPMNTRMQVAINMPNRLPNANMMHHQFSKRYPPANVAAPPSRPIPTADPYTVATGSSHLETKLPYSSMQAQTRQLPNQIPQINNYTEPPTTLTDSPIRNQQKSSLNILGDQLQSALPPEECVNFNIDTLLEEPIESGGSFLQQLEDVMPMDLYDGAETSSAAVCDSQNATLSQTDTNNFEKQANVASSVVGNENIPKGIAKECNVPANQMITPFQTPPSPMHIQSSIVSKATSLNTTLVSPNSQENGSSLNINLANESSPPYSSKMEFAPTPNQPTLTAESTVTYPQARYPTSSPYHMQATHEIPNSGMPLYPHNRFGVPRPVIPGSMQGNIPRPYNSFVPRIPGMQVPVRNLHMDQGNKLTVQNQYQIDPSCKEGGNYIPNVSLYNNIISKNLQPTPSLTEDEAINSSIDKKNSKKFKSSKTHLKDHLMSDKNKRISREAESLPDEGANDDNLTLNGGPANFGQTPKKQDSVKKKPPATFKLKKRKRKKGQDPDGYDHIPPDHDNVDTTEKRRSSRNVKRMRYVEHPDISVTDDVSDGESSNMIFLNNQEAVTENENTEEKLVVEKILDVRIRKIPKENIEEKDTENVETTKDDTSFESQKPSTDTPNASPKDESIKDEELAEFDSTKVEEYFLKYKNYSYLHCEWKTKEEIKDERIDGKIKRFKAKLSSLTDRDEPFNPDFVEVERVLDVSSQEDAENKVSKHYFVKWCSLPYEDSTWEHESDVPADEISKFIARCKYRPPKNPMIAPNKNKWRKLTMQDDVFKNDNRLRDYQLEGLSWLLFNWYNRRNCILADEMGLGKTIQSITFLQKIFDHGIEGPFLVVAPLSTIGNWQREFAAWTSLNAVVYHGGQMSREMIKTYEFLCRDENLAEIPGAFKMHAVITTYEMIVLESSDLLDIEWKCLIIDEAHRLKNQSCKLADSLRSMQLNHKVLLTGTPLQNNVEELFALLNFLQPEVFNSSEAFLAEFSSLKDQIQVEKLQELLKPIMLRRLKEDVEKSLAPKEETIIEVELTNIQKKYYRAILERNFEFLSKGAAPGNVPNLMNTMMELRKCCNHPYLIKGAEDKIHSEQSSCASFLETMIQSSGKLVLIDKLLPKLKSGGHKVLIFSQMVRCLDILEDYLMQKKYTYERIDGCVRGSDRQTAIDRFSKPDSDRFVFLLCTRAGGLGINLTAADTVIIFDSDWNPQNDLQAQARCHRIGQKKTVKIYRLITRNSYEREMFDKASLKLGLDKAVLQSISGRQDQKSQMNTPSLSKQEVEDLLKRGAYGAIMDEDDDSKKFCEEDIDQILERRAHTITIASGEKGSTFSKASFVSGAERTDISLDDPNFWEKWAKKADLDVDRLTSNNELIIEEPRRRKQTSRFGGMTQDAEVFAEIGSDSDSDYEEKQQSRRQKNKCKTKNWSKKDYFRVQRSLLTFGWGRWKHMLIKGGFPGYIKVHELEQVSRALLMHCLKFYNGDEKIKVFIWDLITPSTHSTETILRNHEGLSAPVPRGRKGRRAKDEAAQKQNEEIKRSWVKDFNIDMILQEEGFKKHLQHHCNKILLRVRMLYYLHNEILGSLLNEEIDEIDCTKLNLEFPDVMPEFLSETWDHECDTNLLVGVLKHGYEKYNLIRADPKFCFLKRFGMPDNKSLADDLDFEAEEDHRDPEYKPTKVNFNEFSEFEDSPMGTPATEPTSPESPDSCKPASVQENDSTTANAQSGGDGKSENLSQEKMDGGDKENVVTWPAVSELNLRIRRIISCYQKHHKQIQLRLLNVDQNISSLRLNKSDEGETLNHWTRREEADFYRTVSTFGVEYDGEGNFSWRRFRQIAKLQRKNDKDLKTYFHAFKAMCQRVCNKEAYASQDVPVLPVAQITEERASRTLYRLNLLDRVRLEILRHEKLDERLKLCEHSPYMPVWWKPGHHDKELLKGMDRHGVTRTEIHILTDKSLSFMSSMQEHEAREQNRKRARKRTHETDLLAETLKLREKKIEEDTKDTTEGSSEPGKEIRDDVSVLAIDSKTDDDASAEVVEKRKIIEKLLDIQRLKDSNTVKEGLQKRREDDGRRSMESAITNNAVHPCKWPKDRVLIQRVEHICSCVRHKTWPIPQIQDCMNPSKVSTTKNAIATDLSNTKLAKSFSKSSTTQPPFHPEDLSENLSARLGKFLPDSFSLHKSHIKRISSDLLKETLALSNQNMQGEYFGKSVDAGNSPFSDTKQTTKELLEVQLLNNQFTESLQNLLKSASKQASSPPRKSMASVKHENILEKEKPDSVKVEPKDEMDLALSNKKEKNLVKTPSKKKSLKSLTGFISPAVLPSDAHIPVHNPSKKERIEGENAPLNRDLADWLKQHPGFVVDYKSLRQKLDDNSLSFNSSEKKTSEKQNSSRVSEPSKNSSSKKPLQPSLPPVMKQSYQSQYPADPTQAWLNLQLGLMQSFYGITPEMTALMMKNGSFPGMMPTIGDTENIFTDKLNNKSKRKEKKEEEYCRSKKYSEPRDMSYQNFGPTKSEMDAALLASAVMGYLPESDYLNDPFQLLSKQSMAKFDTSSSSINSSNMNSFLAGLPQAMNPMFPFLQNFSPTSFMPEDYMQKIKATKSTDMFEIPNQSLSNAWNFNNAELQKFLLSENILQAQISALQASSSQKQVDNTNMEAIYKQLASSLIQNEGSASGKKGKRAKSGSDGKDEPMNLSSSKQYSEK